MKLKICKLSSLRVGFAASTLYCVISQKNLKICLLISSEVLIEIGFAASALCNSKKKQQY